MIIYAKVVYSTGIPADERVGLSKVDVTIGQKEFRLRDFDHLNSERMRRSFDEYIVCDAIDINRYDTEDHLEIVARIGKVSRHFHFTKVVHVEIDEEVSEV